jgi:hypothetical protein
MKILADVIYAIHLFIVIAVITIPFTNSNYFLFIHSIFVPFMLLHWATNNNTCILTTTEKYFRGKTQDDKDCITCQLINPIFDVTKNYDKFSKFLYVFVISLWSIGTYRLYGKFQSGSIKNFNDLYRI